MPSPLLADVSIVSLEAISLLVDASQLLLHPAGTLCTGSPHFGSK